MKRKTDQERFTAVNLRFKGIYYTVFERIWQLSNFEIIFSMLCGS